MTTAAPEARARFTPSRVRSGPDRSAYADRNTQRVGAPVRGHCGVLGWRPLPPPVGVRVRSRRAQGLDSWARMAWGEGGAKGEEGKGKGQRIASGGSLEASTQIYPSILCAHIQTYVCIDIDIGMDCIGMYCGRYIVDT